MNANNTCCQDRKVKHNLEAIRSYFRIKLYSVAMCIIHLWGEAMKPSLVSPESIALYWFINLYNIETTMVFSNNTDVSPNNELPVCICSDGSYIYGYQGIVEMFLDKKMSLLEAGLIQHTVSTFGCLTDYQLYLNKVNYEKYTRKIFSYLLHWPMWYNTPLKYRELVKKKCANLGYIESSDDANIGNSITDQAEKELARSSKAFRNIEKQHEKNQQTLNYVKYSMQYMSKLDSSLTPWIEARKEIGKELNVLDILLYAHIYVQMILPDGARIKEHLKKTFPEFFTMLMSTCDICSSRKADKVTIRDPTFLESGNIPMTVYRSITSFF
ncbi:SAM complex subunit SAM37 Ecym_3423 [Eremothecium cymbalariae DBVPG|uniref:Mitochondrial outer membrane transport complex Sam37/metaxin N-terminal domain-containing protein n=1 Tax=Eremothecium cymbalariae (strain CBS 270.75 / DBVPG 7215 / KCTC 17166 / NRRL Y-17582) TaxID=931890 RepID=G8JRZ0_ERECY|nr:Hypothetical protein Ecym_3423 [Eremothecium cymbalariae DBVPG\